MAASSVSKLLSRFPKRAFRYITLVGILVAGEMARSVP